MWISRGSRYCGSHYRKKTASLSAHVHVTQDGELVHVDDVHSPGLPRENVGFPSDVDVLLDPHGAERLFDPVLRSQRPATALSPSPSHPLLLLLLVLLIVLLVLLGGYHSHPLTDVDHDSPVVLLLQPLSYLHRNVVGLGEEFGVEGLEDVLDVVPTALAAALLALLAALPAVASSEEERLFIFQSSAICDRSK